MYYQRPLVYRIVESFFRHRRLFFVTFLTIVALITAFVATRPKTYNAQYTVVMNAQTITNPLSNQGEQVDWNAVNQTVGHFQTLVQTREFLQSALQSQDGAPVKLNHPIDFNNQDAVVELQKNIYSTATGSDAFMVGMTYGDPDDTVKILRAVISLFIERNAQEKSSYYTEQVSFIGNQVKEYKDKLTKAEAQLSEFKRENASHLPSQQEAIEQQLVNLNQQVQQYQLSISMDQEREKVLADEVAHTPATIVASQTASDSPLDMRLKALSVQLDEDTSVRGMKSSHPEVVALTQQIKALMAQRAKLIKKGSPEASGITSTNTQPNPQYQFLNNQLVQLRIEMQGLQAQIADTQSLVAQTKEGVAKVPEEERILANLQRDYAFNGDSYNLLNRRLQEAIVNEQLNLRQERGMYNLYLTAPPQSSTSRSKTAMLFLGGILMALIVSIGLVVLSEALDRSFRDPYDMQRSLGVPVLAMLPESPDLHVADSKNPMLPGGRNQKRLTRGRDTALLGGPTPAASPAAATAAAAAAGATERQSGNFTSPGFGAEPAKGAGGAS